MDKRSVFIVNADTDAYANLFLSRKWEITERPEEADLFLFTGGPDVHPDLYGHALGEFTKTDTERDKSDLKFYEMADEMGTPCAGICRGAQFLHVMAGGSLIQHMDVHGHNHLVQVDGIPGLYGVTSTHHQMMYPLRSLNGQILARCSPSISSKKIWNPTENMKADMSDQLDDIECIFYPDDNLLCFQPHPEMDDEPDCPRLFFYFLENYLFSKEQPLEDRIPF